MDSGPTSGKLLAYYDPDISSLRTSQPSLLDGPDSMSSSLILPPTGGMRNGRVYERPTLALPTDANAGSVLLKTPVAAEGTKPSNTMGVARRAETGQVFLTNQIVTLLGLDPTE